MSLKSPLQSLAGVLVKSFSIRGFLFGGAANDTDGLLKMFRKILPYKRWWFEL